jgi:hypothetical protein
VADVECVVYWLFDERCICLWRHGYIGITSNWKNRFQRHRRNSSFPTGFSWTILFRGSKAECRKLEWQLRPSDGIGWNRAPGGGGGGTNRGRIGQKKSDEERAKISASKLGQPKGDDHRRKMSERMFGQKLRLGRSHSDETKQRIRAKKTGIPIHSEEEKRKRAERWKGNSLTKGQPWSAARRLAWLRSKEA